MLHTLIQTHTHILLANVPDHQQWPFVLLPFGCSIYYLCHQLLRKLSCVLNCSQPGSTHTKKHAHASTYTNLAPVCVVLLLVGVQQPRQAEVGDLDVIGGLHQHVAGRQVPVDQPPLLQVHHPLRERERERRGERWLWILSWSSLSFYIPWSEQSEIVGAVNVSTNIKLLS